ncbi:acyl carrier protein [Nguyenibacter vanlangensis]|uniref:Acyl carrier protein n=1 Tax=Nguyenibacter vanlangensis TaxID=1216886 RepID=A0A7Y7ITJ6_9PROT|nr:acyl carrier protein [Nguyenibacter vanlangensis]NVN10068.1 acyl carrier protein [Nguyenibacter vanlangensis]
MGIEQRIKEILVSDVYVEVPVHEIQVDDSMRDVLGVDSLGFVELKDQVEKEYNINIEDADFTPENFGTIRSLTSLIERLRT